MELNSAKNLLEKVFSSSYSRENFKQLVAEIFNGYDRNEQSIHQESFHVENFTNLGLYEDDKGKKIAVYEVELLNVKSLHHSRVAQRNLIASQLKSYNYDGALISFYHANQDEWRVSFITRESSIDMDADKLKFIEHLTPARRKSFIAGLNEGSHTAKKQFLERLQSTDKPSFDEIARIFEIEAVNDDFYEQYKELYLKLTEELKSFIEGDEVIAEDFKHKEVSASDFAKKTLGQFVFLYFIQRKGWIKDKDNPDKKFSFNILFDNKDSYGDNFFNDIMEPIFYELLAKKDPNFERYPLLKHYEFPYLNGGLFEPIRGYDWEKTSIMISDEFFKNKNKTKDGDIGDGLFDVFNRFNFTIYENDPLEQDIAVDPEMLGKVFENLLSIKDRKSKGAFYTPREIVQYMCQESLANFLDTKIGDEIPLETLKFFIKNHSILEAKDIKGMGLETLAENAIALDQLLENVKVCDPAVGSGAFPMGMLSEIVGARNFLQPFLSDKRTIYDLKLHTIGQSLYGVDLDPSAVDIARLRFWLSLIIEEDTPTPLPNLEHKVMQGNSLLSSYEGEELFNDQLLVNEDSRQEKLTIIDKEVKALEKELKDGANTINIPRIQAIKKHLIRLGKRKIKIEAEHTTTHVTQELFENDDTLSKIRKKVDLLQSKISQFLLLDESSVKEDLKNEIENIKWDLIEASVDSEGKAKAFQQLKNKRIQPFFLWKLEFIDVFRNHNGFDIVIANPPYGGEKISDDSKRKLSLGSKDAYGAFILTSLSGKNSLLNENGFLAFIVSDTFMTIKSHLELRKKILNYDIRRIIRLHPDTFKATVNTAILLISKIKKEKNICEFSDLSNISVHNNYETFIKILEKTGEDKNKNISNEVYSIYHFDQDLINLNTNVPFFTCHPKLFKIFSNKEQYKSKDDIVFRRIDFNNKNLKLVKLDNIADVRQGLATGDNKYYLYQNPEARGNYKNINHYENFLFSLDEVNDIKTNEVLRKKIINKGFHKDKNENNFDPDLYFNGKYILPYDKGGASDLNDGWLPNYHVPTEYYIDWSCESVKRIKTLTIGERDGVKNNRICSRFQNEEHFFKTGITFSWTGQYSPTFRIATPGPFDHGSSAIFSKKYSSFYLNGLLCSKLFKYIARNIINHTVNFGIDDVKDFIIPLENSPELENLVKIIINKQKNEYRYKYMDHEQKDIDKLVYELFGLDGEDVLEVEKWYARRYPKLIKR